MSTRVQIVVLLPVYNDWTAVSRLLPLVLASLGDRAVGVMIVDDGSVQPMPAGFGGERPETVRWLRVLRLRRNLGHQRAIAVGLCHIYEHVDCDAVVVMDADGEDRPEDVPRLLARLALEPGAPIVFAERRRRAEGWLFKLFYRLYRALHILLTGASVRVGNFSVIPRARLSSLVIVSELWIHYAASAFRSKQPMVMVPTTRGHRLDGRSHMNFVALVVHGMSAISVYSDVVFTRLVVATAAIVISAIAMLGAVLWIRAFTAVEIPGWAPYATGLALILLLQAIMFGAALTFQVLGSRQQLSVIPQRDYHLLVDQVFDLPCRGAGSGARGEGCDVPTGRPALREDA